MENLVLSIMTQIFARTHEDYYIVRDKDGRVIRNKRFHVVLEKFWKVFESDIAPFSHLHDKKQLEKIEKKMFELKDDFNVDVHELGTYRSEKELLGIRSELAIVISFLQKIDSRIK